MKEEQFRSPRPCSGPWSPGSCFPPVPLSPTDWDNGEAAECHPAQQDQVPRSSLLWGRPLHGVAQSCPQTFLLESSHRGDKPAVPLASCSTNTQWAEMSQTISLSLLHPLPACPTPCLCPGRCHWKPSAMGTSSEGMAFIAAQGTGPLGSMLNRQGQSTLGVLGHGAGRTVNAPLIPASRRA